MSAASPSASPAAATAWRPAARSKPRSRKPRPASCKPWTPPSPPVSPARLSHRLESCLMEPSHNGPHPPMERRSFLKWATHGLGALFGVVLGIPAVAYLIDARNRAAKKSDFRVVGKLSDLKVGEPAQAAIRDVR